MSTKKDQKGQLRGIVLDVDGTLLDPWHRITPATAARLPATIAGVFSHRRYLEITARGMLRAAGTLG